MTTPPRKTELTDGRVVVEIGTCAGRQAACDHVETFLAKAGIQTVVLGGSRVYAFGVLESDAHRAAELLRGDPQRHRYGITVYDG